MRRDGGDYFRLMIGWLDCRDGAVVALDKCDGSAIGACSEYFVWEPHIFS